MLKICLLSLAVLSVACAANPRPAASNAGKPADERTIIHLLSRSTFGPRASDIDRARAMGIAAFLDEQLHPERISDWALDQRLLELKALEMARAGFSQISISR